MRSAHMGVFFVRSTWPCWPLPPQHPSRPAMPAVMSAASTMGTLVLVFALLLEPAQGGMCWVMNPNSGRCKDLLMEKVTKEKCCSSSTIATSWSSEDMDDEGLFFWRAFGGGVKCESCIESCAGVKCGDGRKCVVRRGQPKCVCLLECRDRAHHKGPVCGTDGRSYRSVCRLLRRACRPKFKSLTVAYNGQCQSSCSKVQCPAGKHCLLDQNLRTHCVRCGNLCPARGQAVNQVCGTDGVTYPSPCHLREAACHKGKAIPEAYKGQCKQAVSCGSVQCRKQQSCLIEPHSGTPRCVTCSRRCPKASSQMGIMGPICGTNNFTYDSWCHMYKDSCNTGYVIETKFVGHCREHGNNPKTTNTILDATTNDNS